MNNTNLNRTFLHDAIDIISISTRSIESDDFNRCFQPLSRFDMDSSGIFYVFSFFLRYFVLLPLRVLFFLAALIIYIALISKALVKNCENTMKFAYVFVIKAINVILCTRVIHYGKKHRLLRSHIFVANHTSFLDFIILSNHGQPHACISENHGGLFNMLFSLILGRNGSIAFKRSEKLDRSLVKKKLKEHATRNRLPMLVFPEGTCVNNSYSVMFQKGVFELGVDICPISIKYNKSIFDPYWNRKKYGFAMHSLYLMTRWYISADVYWHNPIEKNENETPTEFANRTKSIISSKINLINTMWNGYLKSSPAIRDRELLKIAFIKTYHTIKSDSVEEENVNIDFSEFIIFEKYNYKAFLLELLKTYHSYKNMLSEDQDNLFSLFNTNLLVRCTKKQQCSCNFYKSRKLWAKKQKLKAWKCRNIVIG